MLGYICGKEVHFCVSTLCKATIASARDPRARCWLGHSLAGREMGAMRDVMWDPAKRLRYSVLNHDCGTGKQGQLQIPL